MRKLHVETSVLRYCTILLTTACALIAGLAGFSILVDPFGMYRVIEVEGFNAYKPAIYNRVRLYKAFELRRIQPRSIILGTSRTHLGLSCAHRAWTTLAEPCYNLAFDGATTREMFSYLRHAHALQPLRHLVLGLDTYHPSPAPSFTRPDFDPLVLLDGDTPLWWRIVTGDLRLLANLDTLHASIRTLNAQRNPERSWFASNGQRLGEVFFRRDVENFMVHGPRAYFDEIDRMEVGFQTEDAGARGGKTAGERAPAAPSPEESSLAYIRRIVEFCRSEGIDLRIFISPSHVHQLEIAAAVGSWGAIEDGKRALVRMLAEDSAQHPGRAPVPLIDFSGYSPVTTEALPPPGSRAEMRYYWDSSHFKQAVGDCVLDRLFGATPGCGVARTGFGISLDEETLESTLARDRAAQAAYRERYPGEVATLRSLVRARTGAISLREAQSAGLAID